MGEDTKPVVAIAGASGFVGGALRRFLVDRYQVVGLTRSPTRARLKDDSGVEWRHCDLFDIGDVEGALAGVDYTIYLVHSMQPSARLNQASFMDLDLLLADNFARAAERNGIKQVIYIGGIRPHEKDGELSRHLESRLEVERTLARGSAPVTALGAGIILGPGGSSMRMMVNLVRRLPVMLLPSWTDSLSAPIAVADVVRAVDRCLGQEDTFGRSFEIGGPEKMSYRDMIVRTARVLQRDVTMLSVPFFSPALSRRWVALVTGSPDALVGPLIESLRHDVVPQDNWLNDWLKASSIPFDEALQRCLDEERRPLASPRDKIRAGDDAHLHQARTVRSVQRLPLPNGVDARWVADEYARWLPRFVWPFMQARVSEEGVIRFSLRFTPWVLLELTPKADDTPSDRRTFRITGGALARVSEKYAARFEFREVLDRRSIIAAVHDFRPTLPWFVYNFSQAVIHLIVMRAFGRHLARIRPESPSVLKAP